MKPLVQGFTLIELLVALAVFAIAGFAVTARVGDVATQTFSIERRTMAHWVAENHLAKIRLRQRTTIEPLSKDSHHERLFMSGRKWRVHTDREDTTHPWLQRIEITVFEVTEDDEVGPLDTLVAFIGRY